MNDDCEIQHDPELQLLLTRMDPLARNLFDHAARMNRASQRHIFQKFHAQFSRTTPRTERETLAANAIATAKHELGIADDEPLPANKYAPWFKGLSDDCRKHYPSATTIRRAFHNNWTEANNAVTGSPVARFRSVRRRARGKEFTNAEIRFALQLYASEKGHLHSMRRTWGPWARIKNAEGVRVPIAFHTVRQRFASFEAMCEEAGIEPPRSMSIRALPLSRLIEIVRQAACDTSGKLTGVAFIAWRASKLEEDPSQLIPSRDTIASRLGNGSWDAAVCIAFGGAG